MKKDFIEIELKILNYERNICLYDSISHPVGTYDGEAEWDTWGNG